MIDLLFVDKQVIMATTALMSSAMAMILLATLHTTAPTRFLPQKHHTTKTDLVSRHQYTYTHRDRSHSTYYGPRHGRHFSRSQSCCHSHCKRSSSFRRHTLGSSSSQGSSFGWWTPHHHSHHDTNQHSHTPSHTCHFSHRCHSCHSTDRSWSHSSNYHHPSQEPQPRKALLCPRPPTPINPTGLRLSPSRISPSNSSSDLDSDSDPLNY